MTRLPTVEDCRAFHATINQGRAAIDLPPLEYLDFDSAVPGEGDACLSTTNLFAAAGYIVGERIALLSPFRATGADQRVDAILGPGGRLPTSILCVTGRFDGCWDGNSVDGGQLAALRARLVEAGVVQS